MADKRENPAKKKRAKKPRQDTIDGFEPMEKNVEPALFQSDLVTEFEFPDRKPSLTNLIQYFFDEEFLDLYVQENINLCDSNELPNLIINPNSSSRRRNLLVVRRKFVLRFIATRFLIMSNPNHKLKKNWPLSNQFNDLQGRQYLGRDNFQQMISHINPVRFKEVWEKLGVHVQKPGDWVNFYNEDTQEHAMMRYDPLKGDRKQHVITNVFENRKKVSKKDPIINVISDVYLLLFNGCDRLNSYFDNKYWPYHRWGWQSNFDDFFFSAISMNIYEINQIALEDKISWDDFALMCARATIDYIEGL